MAWFLKRGVKKGLQKVGGSMGLQEIASTQHQIVMGLQETAITQHQIVTELRKLRDICSRIQYQMPVPPDSLPIPPRELHALVVAAHRLSAVENCDQLVNLSEMTGAVKANYGLR